MRAALAPAAPGGPAVDALTLASEGCGTGTSTGARSAQPFGSGAVLRAGHGVDRPFCFSFCHRFPGLGWDAVLQPETNMTVGATPRVLWRCRAALPLPVEGRGGGGSDRYSSAGLLVPVATTTLTVCSAAFDDP